MKKNFYLAVLVVLSNNFLCYGHSDVPLTRTGSALYFSSIQGKKYQIIFNIHPNKNTEFKSITIIYENTTIEINSEELNLSSFSRLDKVELYHASGTKSLYLFLSDKIGDKGARIDDMYYFNDLQYLKRVTLKATEDITQAVEYVTKEKGKPETKGLK